MIVIDASLAAKWFLSDEASVQAERVLDLVERDGAIVPSLFRSEIQNMFLTAVRAARIGSDDAEAAFEDLNALPIRVEELGGRLLVGATARLAAAYGLTAYDAEYLAVALDHQADIYTGDAALWRAAKDAGLQADYLE